MLPQNQRVTTSLFQKVLKEGRFFHSPHFSLRISSTSEDRSRFSVSVPKKVKKSAVDRNYLRRRTLSALRASLSTVKPCLGVFFVKADSESLSFESLKKEIADLLIKAGVLK